MTTDEKVLAAFYDIISDSKKKMFDDIASNRTRYLTVAMENVQKDHNASAVTRTCDCFGIQDLHTIEKGNDYKFQRDIARGASNWIHLHSHSTGQVPTLECISKLKSNGYKIVATSPHADLNMHELAIDKPIALVFGTEKDGITQEAENECDELVKIPMYGFTESYNISVSVAILISTLRNRLEKSDLQWKLSHEDQVKLKIEWCANIIKEGERVENEIRRRILEKE
jgi:tRNA (guanosine-2'-O-)-methyltransferase